MSTAVADLDYSVLALLLDLPAADGREEQVRLLVERRVEHLESLRSPSPLRAGAESLVRLRAARREEIRVIEKALTDAGVALPEEASE